MTQFGVPLFGRELFGFSGASEEEASSFINPYLYQLELYSPTAKIATVVNWISGKWETIANLPSLLVFTIPVSDDNADNFRYPNRVVLRDEKGVTLEWFCITSVAKQNAISGARLVVSCQSILWVLGFQYVSEYNETNDISILLSDLLGLQVNSFLPRISMGTVDSVFKEAERNLYLKNTSVLRGVLDLRKSAGGWLWVDAKRRLNWRLDFPNKKTQQLRIDKNLTSVEFEYDYSDLRTVITGTTPNGLSATVSNNVELYGEIPDQLYFPTVKDEASLQALLAVEIAQRSVPSKRVNCTAIDLSYYRGQLDFSHERLSVGNIVRLIDEDINEIYDTRILKVTRDLSVPHVVTIELGETDIDKDILDRLLETEDKVKEVKEEEPFDLEDLGIVEVAVSGEVSGEEKPQWELEMGPLLEAILNTFRGDAVYPIAEQAEKGQADEWAKVDHRHVLPNGPDEPDPGGPVNNNAPVYMKGTSFTGYSFRVWAGSELGWRKIWYLGQGEEEPEAEPDSETLNELPIYLQSGYNQPTILWAWKPGGNTGEGEWKAWKEIVEESVGLLPDILHEGQSSLGITGKYGFIHDADAVSGTEKWTCFTHYLGNT